MRIIAIVIQNVVGNTPLLTNNAQARIKLHCVGSRVLLTQKVQAYRERNDVVITVKDTGIGIPEDLKDKLYTPLFTTKSKGQGFGLAVVKRLTEALGGTVTFESQENKGTTFTIRLAQPTKQK